MYLPSSSVMVVRSETFSVNARNLSSDVRRASWLLRSLSMCCLSSSLSRRSCSLAAWRSSSTFFSWVMSWVTMPRPSPALNTLTLYQ